jgi:hypothetical protein
MGNSVKTLNVSKFLNFYAYKESFIRNMPIILKINFEKKIRLDFGFFYMLFCIFNGLYTHNNNYIYNYTQYIKKYYIHLNQHTSY